MPTAAPTSTPTAEVQFVEVDITVYMQGYVSGTREWLDYGIEETQGTSSLVPSNTTAGDCSDPSTFKVALIDSGFEADHPDSPCVSDGSGGYVNCVGASFGVSDPWQSPAANWHGTHDFGIIAAIGGNAFGVVGMVPQRNSICWMFARVFGETMTDGQSMTVVVEAATWAVDNGARILNMPFGGPATGVVVDDETMVMGTTYFKEIADRGILSVASAGNCNGCGDKYYPASFDGVLSVAATQANK